MSVVAVLLGRLGNNLFQYAVGRIIAEQLGFALDCRSVSTDPSSLGELASFFPNAPLHLPGERHAAPVEAFDIHSQPEWTGHTIDLAGVSRDRSRRQIRLQGYFQRYEYLRERWAEIRHWFDVSDVDVPWQPGNADVVMNIRRGTDYDRRGWILPLDYYKRAIDSMSGIGRVYVCGVGADDAVRASFSRYNPVYVHGTPIQQFALLTRSNRLVLSNSTFGWWGAALSRASAIYAPGPSAVRYGFTGYRDVDLRLPDARYQEIEISDLCGHD